MANEISMKNISESAFTITLASLTDTSGRSSASVSNTSEYPSAIVSVKITSGSIAPDDGSAYVVYLLRDLGTLATDGWGGTDAAFTPVGAKILGTIPVTNDTATAFYGEFDTEPLGPLGPTWGIAIVNESGQTNSTTEADSLAYFNYQVPEIQ